MEPPEEEEEEEEPVGLLPRLELAEVALPDEVVVEVIMETFIGVFHPSGMAIRPHPEQPALHILHLLVYSQV